MERIQKLELLDRMSTRCTEAMNMLIELDKIINKMQKEIENEEDTP